MAENSPARAATAGTKKNIDISPGINPRVPKEFETLYGDGKNEKKIMNYVRQLRANVDRGNNSTGVFPQGRASTEADLQRIRAQSSTDYHQRAADSFAKVVVLQAKADAFRKQ